MNKKRNKSRNQASRPSQNESLNSLQESINTLDRDTNKQTNKIVGLLTKILNWKIVVGIATIITAAPLVYNWITYNPVVETKQNIYSSIKTIEATFRPETIPSDKDSIYNIKRVKKFQLDVKELCAIWQDMESTPTLESLSIDLVTTQFVLDEYFKHNHHFFEVSKNILNDVNDILLYGNKVGEINYQVNNNKIQEIMRLVSVKDEIFQDVFGEIQEDMDDIQSKYKDIPLTDPNYVDKKQEATKDIQKVLKKMDLLKEERDFYLFDEFFFEFLVDTNKRYMIAVNQKLME